MAGGILDGIKGMFAPEPDEHAATPEALAVDEGRTVKSNAEWRAELAPDQYRVLREHGTERPGSSPLNREKRTGVFACAGCGTPVYTSETKYEFRQRLAELLRADPRRGRDHGRPQPRHDADRGPLRDLRRAPRPCLRRRPAPDRPAPLHQRRRAEFRAAVLGDRRRDRWSGFRFFAGGGDGSGLRRLSI